MGNKTRHGTFSIPNDREEWLKQQKQVTGLPESHYVNKGLDIVIGIEEINAVKQLISPIALFFLGAILLLYGIFYAALIPIPVLILIFISSIVTSLIAWFGIMKAVRLFMKLKKVNHRENEVCNRNLKTD